MWARGMISPFMRYFVFFSYSHAARRFIRMFTIAIILPSAALLHHNKIVTAKVIAPHAYAYHRSTY